MQTVQAPANPRDPVATPTAEREAVAALDRLLKGELAADVRISADGDESVVVPASVLGVLRRAVDLLARDRAVIIESVGKELSDREAAEILRVSRPYLVRLLDEGAIPYTSVEETRRIRLDHLLTYAHAFRRQRHAALDEMVRLSEEMGLYDLDFPPDETADGVTERGTHNHTHRPESEQELDHWRHEGLRALTRWSKAVGLYDLDTLDEGDANSPVSHDAAVQHGTSDRR